MAREARVEGRRVKDSITRLKELGIIDAAKLSVAEPEATSGPNPRPLLILPHCRRELFRQLLSIPSSLARILTRALNGGA